MKKTHLACMEVWGGNQATFSSFQKAGLDIWLYSRPRGNDANGGDVYYLSSCASGRISRLLLADVSGHGEPVAEVANVLRKLMRRYINQIRPNKLFAELNSEFAKHREDDLFATSVLNSYFMSTSTLTICNAGHPPPLIYRARTNAWESCNLPESESFHEDTPLGVLEQSEYSTIDVSVGPGDMVLCFTDGVIDADTGDGSRLGTSGMLELLTKSRGEPAERLLPHIVESIEARDTGSFREDDATLLLYRISDRSTSIRDNLVAPFRWLRGLLSQR